MWSVKGSSSLAGKAEGATLHERPPRGENVMKTSGKPMSEIVVPRKSGAAV
jgi:hypothetical protein